MPFISIGINSSSQTTTFNEKKIRKNLILKIIYEILYQCIPPAAINSLGLLPNGLNDR
jgi:hypothetical protein